LERTLVLVKPDGVQRGLIGEIIRRLERRGLRLVAAKFQDVDRDLGERHYAVHKGKPFYDNLIMYITSGPVMAMVWEGPGAIAAVRQTMGSRHDYALEIGRNLTHASDGLETAQAEIDLWFNEGELVAWSRDADRWIFENS